MGIRKRQDVFGLFPVNFCWALTFFTSQVLSIVVCLNSGGVISFLMLKADLQPANILFSVTGTTNAEKLLQPPEFSPVKWLKGVDEDDSAPKYLVPTQRRRGQLDNRHFSTIEAKIGDLGGGKMHLFLHLAQSALLRLHIHYQLNISNTTTSNR